MKKEDGTIDEVEAYAKALYTKGFSCSEALVSAMIEKLELDVPLEVVKMASGFSAGMGNAGCTCGALSGGVMALGLLFGRSHLDEDGSKSRIFAKELHDHFKDVSGKNVVCCRLLTRGFDMQKGEHKSQCVEFVGVIARKAAEIVVREFQ